MPDTLEPPPAPPKRRGAPPQFLFTSDSARKAVAISIANRKSKAERIAAIVDEAMLAAQCSDFSVVRLSHVREHLFTLDEQFKVTTDPSDRKDLAQAMRHLQEQERQLAGRPLPSRADRVKPEPIRRGPAQPL